MQTDSPFFRGNMSPFNTKHALVDPSHTFMQNRYEVDFAKRDFKNGMDKTTTNLDFKRKETFDYNGTMIRRLNESRDRRLRNSSSNHSPVDEFYRTKKSTQEFFN